MSEQTNVGFICLYDSQWNPLGHWTAHPAKSWSLTRKALESDDFKAVCEGFENSKKACFVALHEQKGKIVYAAFCGLPSKDKSGLTQVQGIDCRAIFNQEILVDYTKTDSSGYYIPTSATGGKQPVTRLFQYLMSVVFTDNNLDLDVEYDIDVSDLSFIDSDWKEYMLVRSKEIRNVYNELMAACSAYNVYIETVVGIDSATNAFKLTFYAKRIYNAISVKLSDFDAKIKNNQNVANRAVIRYGSNLTYGGTIYLYNDNTVGTIKNNKILFPPVVVTAYADDPTEASADAYHTMLDNRYKDKVTIDLNSKLGPTIANLDFSYFGDLVGYNPADDSSIKRLPVSAIQTDHKGNKTITFGRLSKYWFLD